MSTQEQLRIIALEIRKADEDASRAKARSDRFRAEARALMTTLATDKVEFQEVNVRVMLKDAKDTLFDFARILTEVPVDKLLSTKTLTRFSSTGFDKLVRELPEIATARTVVAKAEKTLVVEAINK